MRIPRNSWHLCSKSDALSLSLCQWGWEGWRLSFACGYFPSDLGFPARIWWSRSPSKFFTIRPSLRCPRNWSRFNPPCSRIRCMTNPICHSPRYRSCTLDVPYHRTTTSRNSLSCPLIQVFHTWITVTCGFHMVLSHTKYPITPNHNPRNSITIHRHSPT